MEFCRIIRWYITVGERVKVGQPLCEVDTGKASFDIEAPEDGVVLALFFTDDAETPLLTPIAVIGDEGEKFEHFRPGRNPDINTDGKTLSLKKYHPVKKSKSGETARIKDMGSRIIVSPRARLLAQKNNVPLSDVSGSGPGGAIVAEDVQHWITVHGAQQNGMNPKDGGNPG